MRRKEQEVKEQTLIMKTRTFRTRRRGFTLLELLLVLVILLVLAGLVVPKFANRGEQARETAAKTDIETISTALDTFEIDNGRYPTSEEGLDALMQAPASLDNWNGPYLRREPKDPWGNDYVYRYPGQKNRDGYDLYSFGPDGREGNDDIANFGD